MDALVLDIKSGSGAFMKDITKARELAQGLIATANAAGCRTSAVISDMNQPLAPALGNALEMAEAMRVLTGKASGHLARLTETLGGIALYNTGLCANPKEGEAMIAATLASGRAAERFGQRWAPRFGGVVMIDAAKSLYGAAPAGGAKVRSGAVVAESGGLNRSDAPPLPQTPARVLEGDEGKD